MSFWSQACVTNGSLTRHRVRPCSGSGLSVRTRHFVRSALAVHALFVSVTLYVEGVRCTVIIGLFGDTFVALLVLSREHGCNDNRTAANGGPECNAFEFYVTPWIAIHTHTPSPLINRWRHPRKNLSVTSAHEKSAIIAASLCRTVLVCVELPFSHRSFHATVVGAALIAVGLHFNYLLADWSFKCSKQRANPISLCQLSLSLYPLE